MLAEDVPPVSATACCASDPARRGRLRGYRRRVTTALTLVAAAGSVCAVVVSGFAAWWSRQAARGQEAAARRAEWGLNFRAACDRASPDSPTIRQLGVDQLLEMRAAGSLDDDQKRQLVGVTKLLLRGNLGA